MAKRANRGKENQDMRGSDDVWSCRCKCLWTAQLAAGKNFNVYPMQMCFIIKQNVQGLSVGRDEGGRGSRHCSWGRERSYSETWTNSGRRGTAKKTPLLKKSLSHLTENWVPDKLTCKIFLYQVLNLEQFSVLQVNLSGKTQKTTFFSVLRHGKIIWTTHSKAGDEYQESSCKPFRLCIKIGMTVKAHVRLSPRHLWENEQEGSPQGAESLVLIKWYLSIICISEAIIKKKLRKVLYHYDGDIFKPAISKGLKTKL